MNCKVLCPATSQSPAALFHAVGCVLLVFVCNFLTFLYAIFCLSVAFSGALHKKAGWLLFGLQMIRVYIHFVFTRLTSQCSREWAALKSCSMILRHYM